MFWGIINKMNNWGREQTEETEHIKPLTWTKYFTSLLNKNEKETNPKEATNIKDSTRDKESMTFDPILHSRIKTDELSDALGRLKVKKAPGTDGVLVEYLKVFKITRQLFSKHV